MWICATNARYTVMAGSKRNRKRFEFYRYPYDRRESDIVFLSTPTETRFETYYK